MSRRRRLPRLPWPLPSLRAKRWRRPIGTFLALLLLLGLWWASPADRRTWPLVDIFAAIRQVESGGRDPAPDGDGGRSIGPYQIQFAYWRDALANEPSLGGSYEDCRAVDYAERVIAAYMRKWAPAAWAIGDAETIARIHNGGPDGAGQRSTWRYWLRVRRQLP